MSKGLEVLERLYDNVHRNSQYYETGLCNVDFKTIEKELKALEIIKEKKVALYLLLEETINAEDYNTISGKMLPKNECLTQDEYDLLKEVLL